MEGSLSTEPDMADETRLILLLPEHGTLAFPALSNNTNMGV